MKKRLLNKTYLVFLFSFMAIGVLFSQVVLSQNQGRDDIKKDYEYHIQLAKEHVKKGQWDEAIKEYTEAISLKPSDALLYFARGIVYLGYTGTFEEGHVGYEENVLHALDDFNKAIELEPNNLLFYVFRGDIYSSKNEMEKAIEDLEKAISLKPDVALFYDERAKLCSKIGQYKKAISDFSKAIKLKPDSKEKLYSLFVKPYERVFDFNILKDYEPEELSAFYFSRARAYEKDGQIEKAIKDYEQGILIEPSWLSFLPYSYSLIDLYEKENKLNEAIKFYSKVISREPKLAQAYQDRALVYTKLKRNDQALKDYTKAIELEPKNASIYSSRGTVYKGLKKYDKAIRDYTKVIELNPEDAFAYSFRGDIYVLINQRPKAKADFEKACSLDEFLCRDLEVFEQEEKKLEKAEARGKNWVWFADSQNLSWYYDKTRIISMSNKHIRVWIREELKETDDVNALTEELKKIKRRYLLTKGYENFSHNLSLYEIDCSSENVGIISAVDYDNEGKVLFTFSISKEEVNMEPVVPNSIMDALYKMVCKEKK